MEVAKWGIILHIVDLQNLKILQLLSTSGQIYLTQEGPNIEPLDDHLIEQERNTIT